MLTLSWARMLIQVYLVRIVLGKGRTLENSMFASIWPPKSLQAAPPAAQTCAATIFDRRLSVCAPHVRRRHPAHRIHQRSGAVMKVISRMSPPQFGRSSGNSSPTRASSFAQATREVSCERGLPLEGCQGGGARVCYWQFVLERRAWLTSVLPIPTSRPCP